MAKNLIIRDLKSYSRLGSKLAQPGRLFQYRIVRYTATSPGQFSIGTGGQFSIGANK